MADFTTTLDPRSLDKILKRLNNIERQLDTKGSSPVSQLLNITALDIAREAKKLTPVKTGRLRASIHPKFKSSDSFSYANNAGETFDGGLKEPIQEGKEVVVGTNVEYAFKQEQRKQYMYGGKIAAMPKMKQRMDAMAKRIVNGDLNITIT